MKNTERSSNFIRQFIFSLRKDKYLHIFDLDHLFTLKIPSLSLSLSKSLKFPNIGISPKRYKIFRSFKTTPKNIRGKLLREKSRMRGLVQKRDDKRLALKTN